MQTDVHKTAYLVYTTKKMPHVAATVTKMRFVGRNSQVYYNNLHNRLYTDFKIKVILSKETLPWFLKKAACHGPRRVARGTIGAIPPQFRTLHQKFSG